MKKIASVLFIGGMLALVACGPSAEEKAAMEKARLDSIAAVEAEAAAMQAQMEADSIQAAMEAQRIAIEDSMKNAMETAGKTTTKPATKPKTAPAPAPKEETKPANPFDKSGADKK